MLAKSGFQVTEFAHHVAGSARYACAVLEHIAAQLRGTSFCFGSDGLPSGKK
jgi:hypothetical protein